MPNAMRDAIEDVVVQVKSDGAILDINRAANQIVSSQHKIGEHRGYEVALALIKAASRRGLAIRFRQDYG